MKKIAWATRRCLFAKKASCHENSAEYKKIYEALEGLRHISI
jgi:hypothetical protein